MNAFNEVKKNFGFGCMRLPMNGDKVDFDEFKRDRSCGVSRKTLPEG